ncbi:hypothetical protein HJFPF1_03540 [Paramyrothecium foliicola]|nr:hypothetical protein HJFPF1_03540 [Paramyrothecium foliicola]
MWAGSEAGGHQILLCMMFLSLVETNVADLPFARSSSGAAKPHTIVNQPVQPFTLQNIQRKSVTICLMDHFNSTVHNGTLVSTRRGLHVSKTKHQGTRFVNTFAAPSPPSPPASRKHSSASPKPNETKLQERKFRFVSKPGEKTKMTKRGRPRTATSTRTSTPYSSSESGEDVFSFQGKFYPTAPSLAGSSEGTFDSIPATLNVPEQWKDYNSTSDFSEMPQDLGNLYLEQAPYHHAGQDDLSNYSTIQEPSLFPRSEDDVVAVESDSMIGALVHSIRMGDGSFDYLRYYIDKSCGTIDHRLRVESRASDGAMLEAIAAMASACLKAGRYDHWHVHMKGLRYIIAQNGGMKVEWGHVLNDIRKIDVKGAAYTGSVPYLESTRFFPPISDMLPADLRAQYAFRVHQLFQVCGIAQINIDSVRALVFFAQALKLSRRVPTNTFLLESPGYIEEYTRIEYMLIRYPGPLRDETLPTGNFFLDRYSSLHEPDFADDMLRQTPTPCIYEDHIPQCNAVPVASGNLLDPILRIGAILYMEELLSEPRTATSYNVLLAMLSHQLQIITMRFHERGAFQQNTGLVLDGLPHDDVLRPLLIWAAMVVFSIAQVADAETGFCLQPIDMRPYLECVALLVGTRPEDVDALADCDFELCKLLPVQELGATTWDDRTILKRMLADYESRHFMSRQSLGHYL